VRDHTIIRRHGDSETAASHPLEDPYLVGEQASAEARRQRLTRKTSEDVLQKEDQQWDWLLAQMKTWEERDRNWTRLRKETDHSQRRTLLRRIGGLLL